MPRVTDQERFTLGTPALVCRWRLASGALPLENRHLRALGQLACEHRIADERDDSRVGRGESAQRAHRVGHGRRRHRRPRALNVAPRRAPTMPADRRKRVSGNDRPWPYSNHFDIG